MIKFTQSSRRSLFTGEIIGSKFIESQNMLMALCRQKVTKHIVECASFLQHWLEMVLLHYLLTMIILRGQSDTTRLQLQFKQVSLCQKNCICMDLIQNFKISRPIAFKWDIPCPNWTTSTLTPVWDTIYILYRREEEIKSVWLVNVCLLPNFVCGMYGRRMVIEVNINVTHKS